MAIPKRAAVIAALIALAGSGCTQPDPNAKPTYACTPTDGGTPQPCYKAEHDLQVKEDKLYAEAEAVFRRFLAEEERIYRSGGISEPTTALRDVATGEFLDGKMITYRALKQTHSRMVGGKITIVWIRPAPKSATPNTLVTMENCLNASAAKVITPGSKTISAGYTSDVLHFTREQTQLKITSALGDVVDQC
jgi:hypothetical protein